MLRLYKLFLLFACTICLAQHLKAQPVWLKSENFEGGARGEAVSFTLNGKGYLGLGSNDSTIFKDFWQYDPTTAKWTQVADFGGEARWGATAFVLNGKAYVGLGQSGTYPNNIYHKDFWVYDPLSNSWTKTTDFAGSARSGAIAFTAVGKGFVLLGRDASSYPTDVWAFDPASKKWVAKNNFADEGRSGSFVFSLDNTVYVGSGIKYKSGSPYLQNNYLSYKPDTDTWTEENILPSGMTIRDNVFYFSLKGKGYIGGGDETWQFDPADMSWAAADNFDGDLTYSTAFTIDTLAYLATGYHSIDFFSGNYVKDFYKFGEGFVIPTTPSNVSAKITSLTEVEINWDDNSDNEKGFIIERSFNNSSTFEPIATVAANVTSYIDEDLEYDNYYYYRIKAYADAPSAPSYYEYIRFEYPYKAPTELKAYDNAAHRLRLSWKDNAQLEEGYVIERSVNDTLSWEIIDSVGVDVSEYFDEHAVPQTLSYYRVKAFYGSETTDYSNTEAAYLEEVGQWTKISDFPGMGRAGYFTFQIGDKLYLGGGIHEGVDYLKDFWEYDLDKKSWKQLKDFGGAGRYWATAFMMNNKGYICAGRASSGMQKDLWEYSPATDQWLKKTDFGGIPNFGPQSFVINNKAYVLTGLDEDNHKDNTFWQYDPIANLWTQKQDFPGIGRREGIGISANGLGYIGLGISFTTGDMHNDFYEYNPATDSWTEKSAVPGDYEAWTGAFSVVSNNQLYAGTGTMFESGYGNNTDRLWKYNITADHWQPWGRFPVSTKGHTAFVYGGSIYATGHTNYYSEELVLYRHKAGQITPPDNFVAKPQLDTTFLYWYDQSNLETNYVIERKLKFKNSEEDDTTYQVIATLAANVEHYADAQVENGRGYYYRIKAVNGSDSSFYREIDTYTPLWPPDSVEILEVGASWLKIKWANKSGNTERVYIYRSSDEGQTFKDIGNVYMGESYTDYNAKENTTYYYQLQGTLDTYSDFSYVSGKTLLYSPGYAPSGKASGEGIEINWKDASNYETGYVIERSLGNTENFIPIHTTEANVEKFVDGEAEEGVEVYYRVKATSEDNYSAYSEVAGGLFYKAPSELRATLVTADTIALSWKNHSTKAPHVELVRILESDNAADPYRFIAGLEGNTETYVDQDEIKENTLYRYVVKVHDYQHYASSDTILVHTLPAAPSELALGEVGENRLKLVWKNNTSAEAYTIVIEMAKEDNNFSIIGVIESPASEHWVENVDIEATQVFRLRIIANELASAHSNTLKSNKYVTGIDDEMSIIGVTLFPNPVAKELRLLTQKQIDRINIVDVNGKLIVKLAVRKDHTYDVSHLPSGIYFLSLSSGNQTRSIKFVKE